MSSLPKLWVTLSTHIVPPPKRGEAGGGIVEYAAILILVAAIAVAVFQLGLVESISSAIESAVDNVIEGP